MKEEFKAIQIPGYLISNTGKVVSLKSGREMTQGVDKDGYHSVNLRDSSQGQKQCKFLVHRLVALAFIEGYEDGLEVDHKDQNKANNNYQNLQWADRFTQQRNTPNNVYVSYNGNDYILKDICSKFNSDTLYGNILSRVNRGKGSHQSVFEHSIKGLTYVE